MRERIHSTRRRIGPAAVLEAVLFVAGISLLGYCVYAVADAWIFQRGQDRWLQQMVERRLDSERALEVTRRRGVLGRLEIPRLGFSTVVVEGTSDADLRRAAGRIPDSALPGFEGKVAIAGHRDTHFRGLRGIRKGDRIRVVTGYGEFHYEVVSTEVVEPDRDDVLESRSEQRELTLVTCYPFKFVGKAPLRFIVYALEVGRRFYS